MTTRTQKIFYALDCLTVLGTYAVIVMLAYWVTNL
jgi:hypothetical protein